MIRQARRCQGHRHERCKRRRFEKPAARRLDRPEFFEGAMAGKVPQQPGRRVSRRAVEVPRLPDRDQRRKGVTDYGKAHETESQRRKGRQFEREGRDQVPRFGLAAQTPAYRAHGQDRGRKCPVGPVDVRQRRGDSLRFERACAGGQPAFGARDRVRVFAPKCRPDQQRCRKVALALRSVAPSAVFVHVGGQPFQTGGNQLPVPLAVNACQCSNRGRGRQGAARQSPGPTAAGIPQRSQSFDRRDQCCLDGVAHGKSDISRGSSRTRIRYPIEIGDATGRCGRYPIYVAHSISLLLELGLINSVASSTITENVSRRSPGEKPSSQYRATGAGHAIRN